MLPLALIMRAKGVVVAGSDRALDQGRTAPKFEFLKSQGIALFAQDGSGVTDARQIVVASAAVEDSVPDIVATKRVGAMRLGRAELLSDLFNEAPVSIGVAGTSGKSTTTGVIGWILKATGRDPTVMNGAVMTNFASPDVPFASSLVGGSGIFVSEVDESDGSIARYIPTIAVVNNISLDHKSMDELRTLFRDYAAKAKVAVLNLDDDETVALLPGANKAVTYSLVDKSADLFASSIKPAPDGIAFDLAAHDATWRVHLKVPGRHNVSNALAALAAAEAAGVPLTESVPAIAEFRGVRRRLEVVGSANGITIIDDFAHNPDKIAATLATLHDFPGRLLLMFQPQGFGPLRLMKDQFIACFAQSMRNDDVLTMPEPVYFGGTTDRSVSSGDIIEGITNAGRSAFAFTDRSQCRAKLLELAKRGDRIVVMGARDDTLSQFAAELLAALAK